MNRACPLRVTVPYNESQWGPIMTLYGQKLKVNPIQTKAEVHSSKKELMKFRDLLHKVCKSISVVLILKQLLN